MVHGWSRLAAMAATLQSSIGTPRSTCSCSSGASLLSTGFHHVYADGRPRTKCVTLAHLDTGMAYIPGFIVSFVLKVYV